MLSSFIWQDHLLLHTCFLLVPFAGAAAAVSACKLFKQQGWPASSAQAQLANLVFLFALSREFAALNFGLAEF